MIKRRLIDLLRHNKDALHEWRNQHLLTQLDLTNSDLSRVDLRRVDLSGADLSGADLSGANLTNADLHRANLSQANLKGTFLIEANLSGTNLGKTCFTNAYLNGTNLTKASIISGNLSGADLSNADLIDTVLINANLHSAVLSGANLNRAILSGADLSHAIMHFTVMVDIDLAQVKGLETVKHQGTSSIGIDTIYRSGGKIPEHFLHGAGIPKAFHGYIHSLVEQSIEYFTCFISHSSKDQDFCDRLYSDLQASNVRCWYFPKNAIWGKSLWGEIDRNIKLYDKLIVICSQHSLQSRPVLREIERALQREDQEGKNILFPIQIDDYLLDGWKHNRKSDILSKIIGDFREWSIDISSTAEYKTFDLHEKTMPVSLKYQNAFQRLLDALMT